MFEEFNAFGLPETQTKRIKKKGSQDFLLIFCLTVFLLFLKESAKPLVLVFGGKNLFGFPVLREGWKWKSFFL
jgi:hypothetical protein